MTDPTPQTEARIVITYSPTVDPSRDLYDADTLVIPVLDEDYELHSGHGVPNIAIEKGRHEYPAWIQTLVRSKCADMIESGRIFIEVVNEVAVVEADETSIAAPISTNSPYPGTDFECLKIKVSVIRSLALVPEALQMRAIQLLCSEVDGDELKQHLQRWARDPFLKPGVKSRITTALKRLEVTKAS